MTSYVLRRVAESLVVLAVMSFVIYGLIGLMPGDPIDLMLGADPHLTSADVARLSRRPALKGMLAREQFVGQARERINVVARIGSPPRQDFAARIG